MATTTREVQDPFTYLKEDHRIVAGLFKNILDTTERAEKTRSQLFKELDEALTLHADMEEALLYPRLKEKDPTRDLAMEAVEEHAVVKTLLAELAEGDQTTEEWTAKVTVLKENVEHHVKEEEGELFPDAQKVLDKDEQGRLRDEMEAFLKQRA